MFALRPVSDFSVRRCAGALALAWLLAAAGFGALGGLSGCASTQGASGDVPQELRTAADESDARKRAGTRLELAARYFQDGKNSIALDEVKKAMQIDPAFGDAYALSGAIYMALNNLPQAQAHFERALSLNPRDGGAMHNMGLLKCRQKQYDAATAWFQRAIALPEYPDKAKSWLMQGACEAGSGERAKAEESFMRSFQIDPGNPATEYNLAKLFFGRGDLERARFYIRRLNNSEQANAESLWLGIRVERQLNHAQAVEQLALQLRRRFPDSSQLAAYDHGAFDD
ncbi:MAG: type IV pilus biogenesis/stability protein PilW [Burkholderiaceae bacterium]|jgi:type IV pilus assembly protein PilF|nr:type IV pilus biogenesis/stability protein PilW [Burkholderiaceae bacterium]